MIPTIVAVLGGTLVAYITLWPALGLLERFAPFNLILVLAILVGVTLGLYILGQFVVVYFGHPNVPLSIHKAGMLILMASILFLFAPFIHASLPDQALAAWGVFASFPIGVVGFVISLVTLLVGFLKK